MRYIQKRMAALEPGGRLMIFLPPRSYKSELVTVRYTAWTLSQWPRTACMIGCYNQTLANTFSRKVRKIVRENVDMDPERRDVTDWWTATGGGLRAAGVGSGVTGRGADLLVIDDPVRSRADANSESFRDRMWNWYKDDLYTRLEPGARLVLIMCMTGDTPVRMADGTEVPLRDVRVGDRVATYDNGRLGASTVRNHKSNGLDSIFRIKMTCGKIVHANERHPFLIEEHGQLRWIRLRDLTTGHKIVALRDSGGSGKERPVWLKDVKNLPSAGGIASHTTERSGGLTGIDRRQSTQSTGATYVSSSGTESQVLSMTPCLQRRMGSVPSASSLPVTMCGRTGAASSASTIAMTRTPCEDFSATTATWPWATPRQKQQPLLWWNTSDFTTETIESIEPAGVEEVFDIQVDRTENFIANGLVSHNTRWHEDDLAGRILEEESEEGWEIIRMPAIAETQEQRDEWADRHHRPLGEPDPIGRKPGEALVPERFDLADIEQQKRIMGRSFQALMQQNPVELEGGMFQTADWIEINRDELPPMVSMVRSWDKAATQDGGKRTAGVLMGRSAQGLYFILDVVKGHWASAEREQVMIETADNDAATWKNRHIIVEQEPGSGGKDSAVLSLINLSMYVAEAKRVTGDKETRAEPFAAAVGNGLVYVVRGQWTRDYKLEHASFPSGAYSDQVDASSGAFNYLAEQPLFRRKPGRTEVLGPRRRPGRPQRKARKR